MPDFPRARRLPALRWRFGHTFLIPLSLLRAHRGRAVRSRLARAHRATAATEPYCVRSSHCAFHLLGSFLTFCAASAAAGPAACRAQPHAARRVAPRATAVTGQTGKARWLRFGSGVGWVERSETHRDGQCPSWVSLCSTHATRCLGSRLGRFRLAPRGRRCKPGTSAREQDLARALADYHMHSACNNLFKVESQLRIYYVAFGRVGSCDPTSWAGS